MWNDQGNKFQTNFRFLSFSLSSPFSLHWFQVRDAVGDTELEESGVNRSGKLKCKRHFGELHGTRCLSLQSTTFWAASVSCFFFFKCYCCVVVYSECRAYTAQRARHIAVENLLNIPLLHILLLWQSWLWTDALSVLWLHWFIFINLGGGFVCLAAGQRSLLHSVSKAVIPGCKGRGGTWARASQRLGTGKHSLCTWCDR